MPEHTDKTSDGSHCQRVCSRLSQRTQRDGRTLSMLAPFGRLVCCRVLPFGNLQQLQRPASAVAALSAYAQSEALRLTIGHTGRLEQAEQAHRAIEERPTVASNVSAIGDVE